MEKAPKVTVLRSPWWPFTDSLNWKVLPQCFPGGQSQGGSAGDLHSQRERAQGRLMWGRVTWAFTQGHCAQCRDLSGSKWKKAGNAKASDNRKSQNTTNPRGQEKIRGGGFSWENYITPWTAVGQKALALLKERSQSFFFCVWVQITPSFLQQQQGAPSLYWLARMRGLDHCTAACCFISTVTFFFTLITYFLTLILVLIHFS